MVQVPNHRRLNTVAGGKSLLTRFLPAWKPIVLIAELFAQIAAITAQQFEWFSVRTVFTCIQEIHKFADYFTLFADDVLRSVERVRLFSANRAQYPRISRS